MAFDPRRWMWLEACEMIARAERLQRQFFVPAEASARPQWEPPVDVFADERRLVVVAALPGVRPEELEVAVGDGTLVVRGHRPLPPFARRAGLVRMETPYGRFERRLRLPAGPWLHAGSRLEDGLLVVELERM
ncbi:hypothetical protein HRbin39_01650 [bacterium HR39]|nr:hypothetical protein HRbin39_01650 [bacterium HR39]